MAGKASTVVPPWEHEPRGRGEVVGPEGILREDRERAQREVQLIW